MVVMVCILHLQCNTGFVIAGANINAIKLNTGLVSESTLSPASYLPIFKRSSYTFGYHLAKASLKKRPPPNSAQRNGVPPPHVSSS